MIRVFKDKAEANKIAADMFVQIARDAIAINGRFNVALTGGTSPETLHKMLAAPPYKEQVDWEKVYVFWGDERWVPLTDEKSNGLMARRTLLDHVPIPPTHIFYMWADVEDPTKFAHYYEQLLQRNLGDSLSFDLIFLGMGEEGHTASLFPHYPVLTETRKLVDAYYLKSQNMYRITLTAPVINNARNIVLMLFGDNKAEALHEVLEGEHNPDLYPAQLLNPKSGNIFWLVDEAAAKDLATKHEIE